MKESKQKMALERYSNDAWVIIDMPIGSFYIVEGSDTSLITHKFITIKRGDDPILVADRLRDIRTGTMYEVKYIDIMSASSKTWWQLSLRETVY